MEQSERLTKGSEVIRISLRSIEVIPVNRMSLIIIRGKGHS